jgi:hypothetical protein
MPMNARSRKTSARARAGVLIIASSLALSTPASARPLRADLALDGTWTAGPTRLLLAFDTSQNLYSWEESSTSGGAWVSLGVSLYSSDNMPRAVPVVVETSAGNWETHVFVTTDSGPAHLVRQDSLGGTWNLLNDLPRLPTGVIATAVAAVSNVYRTAGSIYRGNGTGAGIGLYVLGVSRGTSGLIYGIYDANYFEGPWNGWINLMDSCGGCFGTVYGLTATNEFTVSPALFSSVWLTIGPSVASQGGLWENHGAVGALQAGQRNWTYASAGDPNVNPLQTPAAVTWYDLNQPLTADYEHTRVNVHDNAGHIQAFCRDHATGGAWDYLAGTQVAGSLAAGPYFPAGYGSTQAAVVAFDSSASKQLMYLGKDDTNVVSGTDTWTMLPPIPDLALVEGVAPPVYTRIEWGSGIGYVYAISAAGRLMEYVPSTNQWANRGYPGETYMYHEYVNALADSRGYTGDGDWAVGELKAECAANEAAMGISHSATEGYSLLCAKSDTPPTHTASQYTMSLDQGQGIGYHQLGAWDPDVFAQISECGTSDMVTGISQRNTSTVWPPATASTDYILCAPAGSHSSNCRPLLFPSSSNRETATDPTAWGNGNVEGECGQGSAIAGVSRDYNTGVVRGILCCDFGTM